MRSTRLGAIAAAALAVASCSDSGRPAHGTATSLIIGVADTLWDAVATQVEVALQPRIFTVRDETTFDVLNIQPDHPRWPDLRRFRQVLPIGKATDFWVAAVLGEDVPQQLPAIVETQDVWARGQGVTAVVLPEEDPAGALVAMLPELGALLDRRFREYALSRMFVSRADTALRDSLAREAGFSILVPNVYRRADLNGTQVFRNHAEMGGVLMRTITVTWRDGAAVEPTPALTRAWRDSVASYAFDLGQAIDTTHVESRALGGDTFELQGVWTSTDPSWPAAGPFIDRVVVCPTQNRTYFLDAWLFAPGKKKYEYMIQLQTLLDSFRCGSASTAAP